MRRLSIVVAFVSMLQIGGAARDQSPAPQQTNSVYTSRATAVLVDVVVRNKKGALVTDLDRKDFEVLEDGVQQDVASFSVVNHGGGIGIGVKFRQPGGTTLLTPTDPVTPTTPDERSEQAVTALLFDSLTPEALTATQRAAMAFVPMVGESDSKVAVFTNDPYLKATQTYTSDLALIRKGIREVTATGTAAREVKQEQRGQVTDQLAIVNAQSDRLNTLGTAGGGANQGAAATSIGQIDMERKMLESQKHMLDAFESLDRDHRGYGTTSALLTVLQTMSDAPGRKTLVLFSEGLPVSPAMRTQMQWIIETANRSNISIYTVDANGLRVTSTDEGHAPGSAADGGRPAAPGVDGP